MSITVVGVFDEYSDAQKACEKLESAGIDKQSIHVETGSTQTPAEQPTGRRGFFAELFSLGDDDTPEHYSEAVRRGNAVVTVDVADESRIGALSDILENCGAVDVDERVEQWKATGYAAPAGATRSAAAATGDSETLKSVEEELKIGKRTVEKGRVRVHRSMTETPVEEQVTLRDESAEIERKQVDRPATEADMQAAFKDTDFEIRETTEEPVVSKSARVVEEVSVGKKASERTETVRDTVRSTQVDVENLGDVPHRNRLADDGVGAAKSRYYAGPERRNGSAGSYPGSERRAGL